MKNDFMTRRLNFNLVELSEHFGFNQNSSLRKTIKSALLALKAGQSVLFLGDRGVGKTEISRTIAQLLGRETYYLNCSQVDATSLTFPVVHDGSVKILTLNDLEDKVIILDELTNARKDLHSFLLSFVLNHQIGEKKFNNIIIVATGNKKGNSSLVNDVPRPLMERFNIIDLEAPTVDDWISYMVNKYGNLVPSYYYSYVKSLPQNLFYDEETSGKVPQYEQKPSPRSHEHAAQLLIEYPNVLQLHTDIDVIEKSLIGWIGKAAVAHFMSFVYESENLLTMEEYLKGRKPENPQQAINLILNSMANMKDKEQSEIFNFANKLAVDLWKNESTKNMTSLVVEYIVGSNNTYDYVEYLDENNLEHLEISKERVKAVKKMKANLEK